MTGVDLTQGSLQGTVLQKENAGRTCIAEAVSCCLLVNHIVCKHVCNYDQSLVVTDTNTATKLLFELWVSNDGKKNFAHHSPIHLDGGHGAPYLVICTCRVQTIPKTTPVFNVHTSSSQCTWAAYTNTHISIKQRRRGRRGKRVRVREVELGRKSRTVHEGLGLAVLHQ